MRQRHNPRFYRALLDEFLLPEERRAVEVVTARRRQFFKVEPLRLKLGFPSRTADRHSIENWKHTTSKRILEARGGANA